MTYYRVSLVKGNVFTWSLGLFQRLIKKTLTNRNTVADILIYPLLNFLKLAQVFK